MASYKRKGKELTPVDDKFPEGMRVLAVDDNPVCLKVLEVFLRLCKYKPTMVMNAMTALKMLREGGEDKFDLVITDVHMPDMDGFKLLKFISLKMDLPVIMLSVDGEKETIMKGITHGACDYLVKPVHIKEIKNIWQHVVRKKPGVANHISSDEDDAYHWVHSGIAEDQQSGAKSKKCSKKKRNGGDDYDENKENTAGVANAKKPRVVWTDELKKRFLEVVKQLGVDRAVPKKILEMMNVDYLTRESVASHLQKHRLYLKRVTNPISDSSERRNLSSYMINHQGSSSNYYGDQRGQPPSAFAFRGSNTLFADPSVLGAHGVSIQSRNWSNARRRHTSSTPVNSFAKKADHIMLDAFPPSHSGKTYANVLREKLLQASNVVPSSHPGSSFAEGPNGGILEPVNQVQPPESFSQFYTLVNMAPSAVGARHDAQFPCLVESSSNLWQNVASSSFPAHMNQTPLAQSQVNIPQINQLPSIAASPGQILPMFQNKEQNQMEGIINTNTPVAGFSEQMVPYNMESNTAPVEMTNDNFSPMTQMVNGGSTTCALPNLQADISFAPTQMVNVGRSISSALPELQAGSSVAPTQMVNSGENASGIATLPMQEGAVDLRALDDQPIYSNPFYVDDIYANMLNQDLSDDAFFSGGC